MISSQRYLLYTGILKMTDEFFDDGSNISINYITNNNYSKLCKSYNIDDIAGDSDTFCRANNLLVWISDNIYHKGDYDNHVYPDALSLLQYSLNKKADYGINCSALSNILAQCLSALGIKSRVVGLIPLSPYDCDCHVVCEAYINELEKWVMFDPTFCTYVTDINKNPLSITEIRSLLADRKEIIFSETAHYNQGRFLSTETAEYYAKDMFSLELQTTQGIIDKNSSTIRIVPIGYDVKKREKLNAEFVMSTYGEIEWIQKRLEEIRERTYIYKNYDILR